MADEHGKVYDLSMLRIKRGAVKACKCFGPPNYTLDPDARKVFCNMCGAEADPFDAFLRVVREGEMYLDTLNELRAEVAELERKRRRTNLFRDMERQYLGGNALPICPNCEKPFYFEHIREWTNRQWYEQMQAKKGRKGE